LIHDIGIRLKCYAVCVQIRRTKYGFVGHDTCLAYNELEFKDLYENTVNLTNVAKSFIKKYGKSLLIGQEDLDRTNPEIEEFSVFR
jgi:tRNA U55 pseudouridine synthase TruB